ncbi:hypothetical protein SKAU_G00193440 [Synaphobranchus kaupii]|uniref:Uncharacterized protein n=1 Tax=Synaphobranchus kaupii TaxID=118154 RepID=A0A9Q1FE08_SYNKA|nr:hypothetical protein SKAU_G00193440 [Synaphobranchus kaupii]
MVPGLVPGLWSGAVQGLIEPSESLLERYDLLIARSVSQVESEEVLVRLLNVSNEPVELKAKMSLGRAHCNADALSRLPRTSDPEATVNQVGEDLEGLNLEKWDWKAEQAKDSNIQRVKTWVEKHPPMPPDEIQREGVEHTNHHLDSARHPQPTGPAATGIRMYPLPDPKSKLGTPTPTAFEKTQTKANPTDPKSEVGTPTSAASEKTAPAAHLCH